MVPELLTIIKHAALETNKAIAIIKHMKLFQMEKTSVCPMQPPKNPLWILESFILWQNFDICSDPEQKSTKSWWIFQIAIFLTSSLALHDKTKSGKGNNKSIIIKPSYLSPPPLSFMITITH